MHDWPSVDILIHGANIGALVSAAIVGLKYLVPIGLSIRDSMRDTALMLKQLSTQMSDHEGRIRTLELWDGRDRRRK